MPANESAHEGEHHHEEVRVTVSTPAGITHPLVFKKSELVAEATAAAIKYFVDQNELAPDDYGLALVRNGTAEDLTDTARLEDYAIVSGDKLHLIVERPQVDG